MSSGASLRGKAAMTSKLRKLAKGGIQEVASALYIEANIEATEVKKRTPVDTGELRASIFVTKPTISKRDVHVLIVAGGPAASYAVYVHEDLEAFHKVGQAKYLESVINESRPHMAARVAKRLSLRRMIT